MRRGRVVVALALVAVGIVWVTAQSLGSSIVYYTTPTELIGRGAAAVGDRVRLGGYVTPGSVQRGGELTFIVTDGTTSVTVISSGGAPSLFQAGKGVVVEGTYGRDGAFHADTVLVKHGDQYRAPEPGETPTSSDLEDG
jgi:cytochrome c-type biogenesis protein CcmE